MTVATRMTTASPLRMTIGTGIAAVVLTILLYCLTNINHTQAGRTRTFHLGNCCHDRLLKIILPESMNKLS